jgi:hypothetical protein
MRNTIQQSGRNLQVIRGKNNLNGLALAGLGLSFYGLGCCNNNNEIAINFADDRCRMPEPILYDDMMYDEEIF